MASSSSVSPLALQCSGLESLHAPHFPINSACPTSYSKAMVFRDIYLMEIIFANLKVSSHLLRAALTSKDFFNPAMNILWRSLDSFLPIVKLLPNIEIVTEQSADVVPNRKYITTNIPIEEGHLVKVDQYCRRVRNITLTSYSLERAPKIAGHIYVLLNEHRRFRLFPSLRSLHISSMNRFEADDLQIMFLCLAPSVSRVNFQDVDRTYEGHVTTYLTQLLTKESRTLKCLYLSGTVTSRCLVALENFTTLSELELCLSDITVEDLLPILSRNTGLKTLQLYHAGGLNEKLVGKSTILSTVNTPISAMENLVELKIAFKSHCLDSPWATAAYVTKFSPSLAKLHVNNYMSGGKDMEDLAFNRYLLEILTNTPLLESFTVVSTTLSLSGLRQIANWTYLKHFVLYSKTIDIDTDEYMDPTVWLFTSLPSLETLSFKVQKWVHKRKALKDARMMTLMVLPLIAKCCPKLEALTLSLPCSGITMVQIFGDIRRALNSGKNNESSRFSYPAPHKLKRLSLPGLHDKEEELQAEMHYTALVAEWIDFVFPCLEKVDILTVGSTREWYYTVESILRLLIKRRDYYTLQRTLRTS